MSITFTDTVTPWLNDLKKELMALARAQIRVGVLSSKGGEMLMIANVHEFGATITPKTAQNLAIPLKPQCKGKSPRDFDNTWILDNGENRFVVRDKGNDEIDFLFLLVPSVTIPERSFIRAGYDANRDKLQTVCESAFAKVMSGKLNAAAACDYIGRSAVQMIQEYMATVQPSKSSITLASAPGKTTTLIQSGRLRDSITYEVTGI